MLRGLNLGRGLVLPNHQPAQGAAQTSVTLAYRLILRGEASERDTMLPHERKLLTNQQLRDASLDQIEDLVQRLNLTLGERGMAGLVWQREPENRAGEARTEASDPFDPPTI
jgi:hypothetical protein